MKPVGCAFIPTRPESCTAKGQENRRLPGNVIRLPWVYLPASADPNTAVSRKALKAMNAKIQSWRLHTRIQHTLESLAAAINPAIQGWIAYYGRFNRAELHALFATLEKRLARWKYKRMRRNGRRCWAFLRKMRKCSPGLFAHWQALYTGRMAQ